MSSPTMRAIRVSAANGSLDAVEIPVPIPGPGEVLVRIQASGVNPLDIKIRAGTAAHAKHPFPAILGLDLAGTVVGVGAGVDKFRRGDEVYGLAGGVGGLQGTLAEFIAADANLLARKPARLTMRQAAALPLAIVTAWEGLVDRANVQPGHRVLVHGGAGGVGHIAVQIALAKGAKVYATGSASQRAFIESLGAVAIDYKLEKPQDYLRTHTHDEGFDIVYDTVGGSVLDASFGVAREYGGHVVSCLGWGTHSLAPLSFRAATYSGVFTLIPLTTGRNREAHGIILTEAAALADAGKLTPLVDDRRFDFETIEAAYSVITSRQATGKVVVDLQA
jgi:NADPH:quinone reductase